ncbi:ATP-binding protein [Streptomyces albus]|uniref:sensor histidine kinase n=1 Tax=Streptomyces albus TaxID=1888 RepID=UPI0033D0065C
MVDHRRPTQLRRRTTRPAPLTPALLRGLVLRPMLGTGIAAGAAWAVHSAQLAPLSVAAPAVGAAWVGLVWSGVRRADAVGAAADARLEGLVSGVEQLRTTVFEALERVEQGDLGEASAGAWAVDGSLSADPALAAEQLLFYARAEVERAIGRAAGLHQRTARGERAQTDLLRNIAQRQNALIGRALEALDTAENRVEDPDILNDFFVIDHLVTQLRRFTENIAVLGGHNLSGRLREPVPVTTVLRRAVEEIEEYDRVKVALGPDKLSIPGHVAPSVVHLLAELLENATQFSDSRTTVQLTATEEQGGLVIAVRDQGMSMPPGQMQHLNAQLDAPQTVDVYAHLNAGRIGLVVTGQLAQRCGIRVQLQANPDGLGVTALALLPRPLLVSSPLFPASPGGNVPPPAAPASPRQRIRPAPPVPPGPSEGGWPVEAVHAAAVEAPTEGRAALPRRPVTNPAASRDAAAPASAPVAGKGPTPGLMAKYQAGSRHAAPRHSAGE